MKISIIGSGYVGATAAYALVMHGVGREIVLVDLDKKRSQAEADDILHAVPFAHPLLVSAGDYADIAGSRVVVIAAGVGQRPGESRLELLGRNVAVFRSIIPQVCRHAPQAVLIVATNPVDVLTHAAAQIASEFGFPSGRVLGSGTTLDTARFRSLLGQHLNVDSQHVHAYVVGEHGDSEVLTWSLATVGGAPLDVFAGQAHISLSRDDREAIEHGVRNAAYHIIEGKGATYYGIGSALTRIIAVILGDQRAILTVCTPVDQVAGVQDVTVSLPFLLGGQGVLRRHPLPVSAEEEKRLQNSAQIVRAAIDQLGL
jgi:L-lactate dehydrogenase